MKETQKGVVRNNPDHTLFISPILGNFALLPAMKRRPKFKVRLLDEAHLIDRGGFNVTWFRVVAVSLLIMSFFILVGVGLVWFTPLKKRLPGYMPPDQRARTEAACLKVDSLQDLYRMHQAYLDNLVKVLNTDRVPDSIDTLGVALPLVADSLMVSSEIEKEFMKKMEEAGYVITVNADYEEEQRPD